MDKEELLAIVGDLYIRIVKQQKEINKLAEENVSLKKMLMEIGDNGNVSAGLSCQKDSV